MIALEVNNTPFGNFTEIRVTKSLDTLSGAFEFSATAKGEISFPIKVGESCRVLVDDEAVVTGFVEAISVDYNSNQHSLQIVGRDKTADVIDSAFSPDFEGQLSLQQLIQQSLSKAGITGISVLNQVSGLEPFSDKDIQSASIGTTVFEFIEQYARKRQVLLASNGDGNIVITRAGTTRAPVALRNLKTGAGNNVLSATLNIDHRERFARYISKSQDNTSALGDLNIDSDIKQETNIQGSATDNGIRNTRVMTFNTESSVDSNFAQERATWEANIRKARSQTYSATVQGHQMGQTNQIWQPGLLVKVDDDFANIIGTELLINRVGFMQSVDQGSTTQLELINRQAYTLTLNEPTKQQNTDAFGAEFLS